MVFMRFLGTQIDTWVVSFFKIFPSQTKFKVCFKMFYMEFVFFFCLTLLFKVHGWLDIVLYVIEWACSCKNDRCLCNICANIIEGDDDDDDGLVNPNMKMSSWLS